MRLQTEIGHLQPLSNTGTRTWLSVIERARESAGSAEDVEHGAVRPRLESGGRWALGARNKGKEPERLQRGPLCAVASHVQNALARLDVEKERRDHRGGFLPVNVPRIGSFHQKGMQVTQGVTGSGGGGVGAALALRA